MQTAELRPQTDIDGLFLTGQDIMFPGFPTAICTGVLTAGAVLGRNTLLDIALVHIKESLFNRKKK